MNNLLLSIFVLFNLAIISQANPSATIVAQPSYLSTDEIRITIQDFQNVGDIPIQDIQWEIIGTTSNQDLYSSKIIGFQRSTVLLIDGTNFLETQTITLRASFFSFATFTIGIEEISFEIVVLEPVCEVAEYTINFVPTADLLQARFRSTTLSKGSLSLYSYDREARSLEICEEIFAASQIEAFREFGEPSCRIYQISNGQQFIDMYFDGAYEFDRTQELEFLPGLNRRRSCSEDIEEYRLLL